MDSVSISTTSARGRRSFVTRALVALGCVAMFATGCGSSGPPEDLAFADDHLQEARGNGPASADKGNDRKDPNGSNGTVKIDGFEVDSTFDGHPNNEPHIAGCDFEVDLYGFDSDLNEDEAVLRFLNWPPTGKKTIAPVTAVPGDEDPDPKLAIVNNDDGTITVDLQDDGAGGGVDIDRQVLVSIILEGNPHPQHGYHIRLETEVASDGRDYDKFKEFWIEGPCKKPEPTATPVPPTATPVPPTATPVPPTATPVPPTATPTPIPEAD